MNLTLRQLKAFKLTARHRSFSRAAEQLFITQSGMSVMVRELESQLGFPLFERTTRKVKLTEFGSKFLPVADRCLLELEAAAINIRRSASRTVRIDDSAENTATRAGADSEQLAAQAAAELRTCPLGADQGGITQSLAEHMSEAG